MLVIGGGGRGGDILLPSSVDRSTLWNGVLFLDESLLLFAVGDAEEGAARMQFCSSFFFPSTRNT